MACQVIDTIWETITKCSGNTETHTGGKKSSAARAGVRNGTFPQRSQTESRARFARIVVEENICSVLGNVPDVFFLFSVS
jgi:hypothetical protein